NPQMSRSTHSRGHPSPGARPRRISLTLHVLCQWYSLSSFYLNNVLRLNRFVPRAAVDIQEPQQLLKGLAVCGVMQERALTTHINQTFVSELVQMVRERRIRYVQFFLDLPYHQALGMRGQQQLHNP